MRGTQIKLIIFDAYGVSLFGGYPDTCKYLAKKYKRDWKELYQVMYTKYFNQAAQRQITQKQAWEFAVRELKLPISASGLVEIHYGFIRPNKFVLDMARKLKSNYKILLLSKNTRTQFRDMLRLIPVFHKVFGKEMINTWEYSLPKASRETMEFVFKRYNVKARECIYTDDQELNLEVPRKMGVHTIFYENKLQWLKALKRILNTRR